MKAIGSRTLGLIVVIVGVAIGVGWFFVGPAPEEKAGLPAPTEENGAGAERIALSVGLVGRGAINTIDPARAATEAPILVAWNIYDRLIQMDSAGRLQPMLAQSWSPSEDMTRWTFTLRPGVRFQKTDGKLGAPLSASDVKYSIERAVKIPGYGRSLLADTVAGVGRFLKGGADQIAGIKAEGDQVIFSLIHPFAFLPDRLATSFMSIVPFGTPEEGSVPPGTGPYRLVNWDTVNETVTLALRPDPWGEVSASAPGRLTIRTIKSETLAVTELRAGNLNWLETNSTAFAALSRARTPQLKVSSFDHNEMRLIALNMTTAPFNGPHGGALGRALNLAINRDAIVKRLGGGVASAGPVPVAQLRSVGLDFDPDEARRLVAGVPEDLRKLEMIIEPADEARFLAEILVEHWRKVGLDVAALPGRSDFFDRVVGGKYQLAISYYGPFVASAEQYLWMYREEAVPVPNVMRYRSKEFEARFKSYVTGAGTENRDDLVRGAVRVLLENPPTIWIVKPPRFVATTTGLVATRSGGLPNFATLAWQK